MNTAKCGVTFLGEYGLQHYHASLVLVEQVITIIKKIDLSELTLLDSSLFEGGLNKAFETNKSDIDRSWHRILSLHAHTAICFFPYSVLPILST